MLTKTLLLISLLFTTSFCRQAFSQTTYLSTLNSGTSTTAELPIYGYYAYSYSQMIYFTSDMNEHVRGSSSRITKIRFYYSNGPVARSNDWVIYLGHTASDNFASTTSWIPLTELTEVYNGDISNLIPPNDGWFEISLQTPFIYNGYDNLVLAVDENTSSYSSSNLIFRQHSDNANNRSILYRNDANNPDPASPPTASARHSYVPQTIFVHEPVESCSGAPVHSSIAITPSIICQGETSAIKYMQTDWLAGLEYVWQKYDGSSWIDTDTTTVPELNIAPQTTTRYRVRVTCVPSQQTDTSEEATIEVVEGPEVTTNITELVVCDGESVNLIADGADSYEWLPSAGLDNTNTHSVNATITDNTTYSVVGITEAGCGDTAYVNLKLLSRYQPSADVSPKGNCTPGNAVTLLVENTIPLNNEASWQYRFLDANNTILQDWSPDEAYTFTSSSDSVYIVYYQYTSSACPSIIPDSIRKEIIIGFGAKADLTAYNCINQGGSIQLYDYFGQTMEENIYQNDLTTASPEIALNGSALYSDNRLILTPSATSQTGKAILTVPQSRQSSSHSIKIEFNLTADQIINIFGTGGADGISYSFGNDVETGANNAHNGSGSKLRISFDAADNGNNIKGIYLIYGKGNTNPPTPSEASTLGYSSNISLWRGQENVPIKIKISNGALTLSVNGEIIFKDIELPAGYLDEDISGWRHCFGALTGGDAMRQGISDLKISSSIIEFGISMDEGAPSIWQNSARFDNLSPGAYHIWLGQPGTTCREKIKTIVIDNTNPHVDLGADTTICEGESLTLNAGDPGVAYIWSGSNNTTNTMVVSTPGSYAVQVTDTNGCSGIDVIQVNVQKAPKAESVYTQIVDEHVNFTLIEVENTTLVDWDFGDGHTVYHAAPSISHTYETGGSYTATATLRNARDSIKITTLVNTAISAIHRAGSEGLSVYPNPVSGILTISSENADPMTVSIIDAQGRKIVENISFVAKTAIDVANYEAGIYFLNIVTDNKISVIKIAVK